jgi:hypothetical protein
VWVFSCSPAPKNRRHSNIYRLGTEFVSSGHFGTTDWRGLAWLHFTTCTNRNHRLPTATTVYQMVLLCAGPKSLCRTCSTLADVSPKPRLRTSRWFTPENPTTWCSSLVRAVAFKPRNVAFKPRKVAFPPRNCHRQLPTVNCRP